MTPREAAKLIGCSIHQVRHLARTGKLRSKRIAIPGGYVYSIPRAAAIRYRDTPQKSGWPRGRGYSLVDNT